MSLLLPYSTLLNCKYIYVVSGTVQNRMECSLLKYFLIDLQYINNQKSIGATKKFQTSMLVIYHYGVLNLNDGCFYNDKSDISKHLHMH